MLHNFVLCYHSFQILTFTLYLNEIKLMEIALFIVYIVPGTSSQTKVMNQACNTDPFSYGPTNLTSLF